MRQFCGRIGVLLSACWFNSGCFRDHPNAQHLPLQGVQAGPAAKIVAAIAQPYAIDSAQAVITVSVGVVTYPEAGKDLDTLMRCADEAMYAAKEKGKNSFQVYRPGSVATGGGSSSLAHPPQIPLATGGA